MPLIKNRRLTPDTWQPERAGAALPDEGDLVVSLATWREHRDALIARAGRTGVALRSGDPLDDVLDALPHVALVSVHFEAFTDGRGFTQANLLRRRYGYRGELRAAGELLPDQLRELERCGFDSVEFAEAARVERGLANYHEIDVTLQPAADGELVFRRRFAAGPAAGGER